MSAALAMMGLAVGAWMAWVLFSWTCRVVGEVAWVMLALCGGLVVGFAGGLWRGLTS